MPHKTEIFLVRHGETNWNAGKAVAEAEQQNLTPRAERQIINAAEILRARAGSIETVYASMEARAAETARLIIENGFSEAAFFQTPLINERDYGAEQKRQAPVAVGGNHSPYRYQGYAELSAPQKWSWKPFPDFESDEEIRRRFLRFVEQLQTARQRRVVAVTHGGLIRTALMHSGLISHRDWENFAIANGAIFKLEIIGANIRSEAFAK